MIVLKDKTLLSLFVATLAVFSSFTAFFPVLPLYLKEMGASNFEVGAVMSAFPVGVLVFRPITGWFMSLHGRRWTLVAGTIFLAVTTLLYIPAKSAWILMAVRFFHGMGIAAFTTGSIVLLSDVTTFENRGLIMGYIGAANYLGFGLGPFLASTLFKSASIEWVFFLAALLAVVGFVSALGIQEPPQESDEETVSLPVRDTLLKRYILVPSLFVFVVGLVQGGVVNFLPLVLNDQAPNVDAGLFFVFFSISVLLIRILAGKVADQYGRGLVIFIAIFVLVASLQILDAVQNLWMLVGAALLYGFGYGSMQPTLTALVADNTTFRTRGTVFSLYYAVFDIGMLSSGYLFGALADLFDTGIIYSLASGLYLVAALFFLTNIQRSITQSVKWIFSIRKPGYQCKICNNQMGVDPCHLCGYRGGFVRSAVDSVRLSPSDGASHRS